jgi:hypothetical protein
MSQSVKARKERGLKNFPVQLLWAIPGGTTSAVAAAKKVKPRKSL